MRILSLIICILLGSLFLNLSGYVVSKIINHKYIKDKNKTFNKNEYYFNLLIDQLKLQNTFESSEAIRVLDLYRGFIVYGKPMPQYRFVYHTKDKSDRFETKLIENNQLWYDYKQLLHLREFGKDDIGYQSLISQHINNIEKELKEKYD